ncbi:MAG: hypothetical protein PVI40_02300 [Chlamydiota bacterium]
MHTSIRFKIIRTFVLTFLLFILLFFLASYQNNEQRLDFLNQRIEELQEIKRGYEAKVVWHENQAQRLQFVEDQLLTAQRHASIAQTYRTAANKVQEQIDRLEREKKQIILQESS